MKNRVAKTRVHNFSEEKMLIINDSRISQRDYL